MLSLTRLAILTFCQQQQFRLNWSSERLFSFSKGTQHPKNKRIRTQNVVVPLSSRPAPQLFSTKAITTRTTSSLLALAVLSSSYNNHCNGRSRSFSGSFIQGTHCHPLQSTSSTTSHRMSTSKETMDEKIIISNNLFETGYLNAKDAYDLDQQLFSTGYTLEQLMELAGLAVAEAVYDISPPPPPPSSPLANNETKQRVLIVCGPGNNGGDGLVAARHLVMFGYEPIVVYPKRSSREEHYGKLVKQCEDVGIQIYDSIPLTADQMMKNPKNAKESNNEDDDEESVSSIEYDVIIDAIFGFSFKGEAREPFGTIIQQMIDIQQQQKVPIVAVDVPSGWNVDEGDVANTGMVPDVLISLTAPKLCSKEFKGRHFVGGRFLPPSIAEKYGIQMPPYPGVRQVMEITSNLKKRTSTIDNDQQMEQQDDAKDDKANDNNDDDDDWLAQYAAYCEEKEKKLADAESDKPKTNEGDEEDWAVQYHNYCVEKEERLKEMDEQKAQKEKMENGEDWAMEYEKYLSEKEQVEKE